MTPFRVYTTDECGADGYPFAWHDDGPAHRAVKDTVRAEAGHRCQRCHHPYVKGTGEWSPCDESCTHAGPARFRPGWSELGEGMGDDVGDLDVWHPSTATYPQATAGDLISDGVDIEARWRILTVHHLNGVKRDLRWWNLTALCQRCHLTVQRRVVLNQPWPWAHSEWFKVHAAAWYALRYEGLELDRAATLERLDELLEMGAQHESIERMAL